MDPSVIKAVSVLKLYRDSLRLAQHLGSKSGNTDALKNEVRRTFRANMHEKDPEKIQTMKEAAFRGLGNYIFVEAQKMAGNEEDPSATS
ncbi:hypothetical protein HOP50_02g17800 [Chloropicon primus]|uniref:Complex 1 LYR protein domain-containing protein n=1 Tax=Chloropicon primus TaxID=1764295 RepID=A0A5B8MHY5_9CHLO|nr:hypothetical protein A3770_02p17830 [Chloropicon primus]UPQ98474.1 hypothetical protein HOP50_02g17800 [Chloropicon primus]|mmetsp:Transcript_4004/g.11633  ORF Transcript_4004/g.11633 Transcript_4004/m.11633 type:complete len:89 (+) Transcript_4004:48-314(+)|eukprot:QDZ19265.1 hypothetical protein A3770_02p17830 [Chloropicon primus]